MTTKTPDAIAKFNRRFILAAAVLLLISQSAPAQTSAFTYNGRLSDSGSPANGSFQFEFKLYDVATGGTPLSTLTDVSATVTNGVFNVNLDFGATHFNGDFRFLEVAVRPQAGGGTYTTFTTRHLLTSVPYAIKANKAGTAESLSCVGCVQDSNMNSVAGGKVTGAVANATNATNAANLGGQPASAYILAGSSISASGLTITGHGQIIAPRIENLAADPEPASANNKGRIYYNTATNELKMSNGSSWQTVNGTTTITPNSSSRSPMQIATLGWYETPRPVTFNYPNNNFLEPGGMAFEGGFVYVGALLRIHKIDAISGEITSLHSSPDTAFRGLAFDGGNLWATNNGRSNNLGFVLRVTANKGGDVTDTFAVDSTSSSFGVVFDGENIWTTWDGSGRVRKMKIDGTVVCTISSLGTPRGMASDGSNVWIAEGTSRLARISKHCEANPTVTYPFDKLRNPYAVIFDGANLWITNEQTGQPNNDSTVTKLRASDGAVLGEYTVGRRPRGLAFDGTNIWVANWGSNTVTKLRASDGSLVGTYPVGTNPEGVVFDGLHIWVSNTGSNNLTRF